MNETKFLLYHVPLITGEYLNLFVFLGSSQAFDFPSKLPNHSLVHTHPIQLVIRLQLCSGIRRCRKAALQIMVHLNDILNSILSGTFCDTYSKCQGSHWVIEG